DFGVQAGVFVAGRLRLSARVVPLLNTPEDSVEATDSFGGPQEWGDASSDSPSVVWGGSVGIAALSRSNFALSPGILVLRTDDTDYGTIAALSVPFEWVAESGLRIGFEVGVGRAFGGNRIQRCQNTGAPQSCVPGEERRVDREAGGAIVLHFQVGWGLVPDRRE